MEKYILLAAVLVGFACFAEEPVHEPSPGVEEQTRPEAVGDPALFCTNPKKAICDEAATVFAEFGDRDRSRQRLFDEVAAKAVINRKILKDDKDPKWASSWRAFVGQLRLGNLAREKEFLGTVEKWRKNVIRRINADTVLRDADQKEMRRRIQRTQIVNMATVVASGEISIASFLSFCGSDGLSPGGYHFKEQIVLCPAHFSELQNPEGFTRTLVHEFGHSIDARFFANGYRKFEECVKGPEFSKFAIGSEASERTAELNAAEAVGVSLVNTPGLSRPEVLNRVARFVGRFCPNVGGSRPAIAASASVAQKTAETFTPSGVAVHFSSDFMLQVLWGRNPDLRELLGCSRADRELPGCSFSGKTF